MKYTAVLFLVVVSSLSFAQPPHMAHVASVIQKMKSASKIEQVDEEGVLRITISKEVVNSVKDLFQGMTKQLPLLAQKYHEAQYLQAKKLVEEYEKKNSTK